MQSRPSMDEERRRKADRHRPPFSRTSRGAGDSARATVDLGPYACLRPRRGSGRGSTPGRRAPRGSGGPGGPRRLRNGPACSTPSRAGGSIARSWGPPRPTPPARIPSYAPFSVKHTHGISTARSRVGKEKAGSPRRLSHATPTFYRVTREGPSNMSSPAVSAFCYAPLRSTRRWFRARPVSASRNSCFLGG